MVVMGKANLKKLCFSSKPVNVMINLHNKGRKSFNEIISEYSGLFNKELDIDIKKEDRERYIELFYNVKLKSNILFNLRRPFVKEAPDWVFRRNKSNKKTNKKIPKKLSPEPIQILNNIEKNENKETSNIEFVNRVFNPFKCLICGISFNNGQGLGGHMSRKHPNQSEKYEKKKQTRERRKEKREHIYEAKSILLNRHKHNYEKLKDSSTGRKLIKSLVREHREEYLEIRKNLRWYCKRLNQLKV